MTVVLLKIVFFQGASNPSCGNGIDLKSYLFLERHCQDCYNLFADFEVYDLCREGCYENDIYFFCLNALHVPKATQVEAARKIIAVDGGHLLGVEINS